MFILNTILIFEIIIIIHELGHFVAAKISKVEVKEFSIGFGPCVFRWGKNKKYSLRLFPLGGFVSFEDDLKYLNKSIFKRMFIVLSGPFFNILLGIFSVAFVLILQGKFNSMVVEKKSEFCNKIEIADEIKKINGKRVFCANDFIYEFNKTPMEKDIDLVVRRKGKDVELFDVGEKIKTKEGTRRVLGVSLKLKKLNCFNFIQQTFSNFLFFIKLIFSSFCKLFTGSLSFKEFSGPVGLTKVVGQAQNQGFCSLVILLAFISINVGIFNLLPLFILDGGQFLFLVFELVFKKKISRKYLDILNFMGFFVLFLFLIIITIKDLYEIFI